jgi:heme/copper-type cytochrome/quinol oxidase subunit 2
MPERDPITEWEHAIGRRIGTWAFVCVLAVVVLPVFFPLFASAIKGMLYRHYALEDDTEKKARHTMKVLWILWLVFLPVWLAVLILIS